MAGGASHFAPSPGYKRRNRTERSEAMREPECKPSARWETEEETRTSTEAFQTTAVERTVARTSEAAPGQQNSAEEREARNSNSGHAQGRAWPSQVSGTPIPGVGR
ncbi:hypothetical protein NDU88_004215 [Pleurodeles waltl]|uniref:Uncharacterized protein n=1 Tax=Pleurodeles waltl TaxID=8319 RepID=A0AAV7LJ51_PLEWA|nr:hypothetical protein NDU88_004215 [Pleurodeles waltl]